MKTLLAGLFVVGALIVAISPGGVGASSGGFHPSGIILHSGAPAARPHTSAVQTSASDFGCGAITCTAYAAGVNGFLQDVSADSSGSNNVYSVATQFSDGTGNIAYSDSFGGTYTDTSSFPASACPTNPSAGIVACVDESQLVSEIQKDMTKNGWTASGTNLFTILLPSGVDTCFGGSSACASNVFCAYHDSLGQSGLIFSVEPYSAFYGCSGAGEPLNPQGFPNGMEVDETVNTLSHEANEAITDPYGGGWWSANGSENGDLCAWWFGAPLGTTAGGQPYNQVINGHAYSLQQEYGNAGGGGCFQHLGGTQSSVSPYAGDNGPLLYHNGSVMRTATVYTIYWVPGPTPAISTSPVITGKAAVAQALTTTNGTWTNSPTGYSYKWQRCDSVGANCVNIGGATASKYTLLSGDAGHTIRSLVLAQNVNGQAPGGYATSAATAVVVGTPKIVTAPAISGTPKVGSKLTVTTGTWTYAPTKFAYQWLRCSSSGTSCAMVKRATKASYTATSADVGHTLVAQVTASNAAGRGKAKSAKTAVVTN